MKANKLLILMLVFFVGCAMPSTVVKTTDIRPSISISGSPKDSLLYVDGINMGAAAQYNGQPNVLILQPGTHKVQIYLNDQVIYDKNIFIESELKNIIIK